MIALIAACAKNGAIGKAGRMMWNIPSDRERFKKLTTGNIAVMGRKTYEEIGGPLSGRMNIVLSRSRHYSGGNLAFAASLKEAADICSGSDSLKDRKIFICGGAGVYREALPYAGEIYLSVIDGEYDGDVFFPAFDESGYECCYKERVGGEIPYTFYKFSAVRTPPSFCGSSG